MKCTWMLETFSDLPEGAYEETVRRYARTCIMILLSTQLFGDKSGTRMHIRWLPYVARLKDMGRYSWCLCHVANRHVVKLGLLLFNFLCFHSFHLLRENLLPHSSFAFTGKRKPPSFCSVDFRFFFVKITLLPHFGALVGSFMLLRYASTIVSSFSIDVAIFPAAPVCTLLLSVVLSFVAECMRELNEIRRKRSKEAQKKEKKRALGHTLKLEHTLEP
ncbi:hypothetical protein Ahy_A09g044127 [Arachis hypogaea]|uniref:Aminotransferase-like plant mobile domain-containing protein n=1 Tax=Arachis hypogaea TaxID=3818 RepID=A0A445BJK3_ARAHY|nr:hypothetical protein Ahy_A09g044127 [Arachis hypogaea]